MYSLSCCTEELEDSELSQTAPPELSSQAVMNFTAALAFNDMDSFVPQSEPSALFSESTDLSSSLFESSDVAVCLASDSSERPVAPFSVTEDLLCPSPVDLIPSPGVEDVPAAQVIEDTVELQISTEMSSEMSLNCDQKNDEKEPEKSALE